MMRHGILITSLLADLAALVRGGTDCAMVSQSSHSWGGAHATESSWYHEALAMIRSVSDQGFPQYQRFIYDFNVMAATDTRTNRGLFLTITFETPIVVKGVFVRICRDRCIVTATLPSGPSHVAALPSACPCPCEVHMSCCFVIMCALGELGVSELTCDLTHTLSI